MYGSHHIVCLVAAQDVRFGGAGGLALPLLRGVAFAAYDREQLVQALERVRTRGAAEDVAQQYWHLVVLSKRAEARRLPSPLRTALGLCSLPPPSP